MWKVRQENGLVFKTFQYLGWCCTTRSAHQTQATDCSVGWDSTIGQHSLPCARPGTRYGLLIQGIGVSDGSPPLEHLLGTNFVIQSFIELTVKLSSTSKNSAVLFQLKYCSPAPLRYERFRFTAHSRQKLTFILTLFFSADLNKDILQQTKS